MTDLRVEKVKDCNYDGTDEKEFWTIITPRGGYVENMLYSTYERAQERLEEVERMLAEGYTLYTDNLLRKEPPRSIFDSDTDSTAFGPAFPFGPE